VTDSSAVEDLLASLEGAIEQVGAREGSEPALHTLRIYLLDLLELIGRDPGIEAASDDLYSVARGGMRHRSWAPIVPSPAGSVPPFPGPARFSTPRR
jgi:hypothetical protein